MSSNKTFSEKDKYELLIKYMCEEEEEARKIARQVLGETECYGDIYGVPTIGDIIEILVNKIKKTE
jgi:hypothetical protein